MKPDAPPAANVDNAASAPRTLPRLVVVLGLGSFLTDASSEMIMPLIPALLMGTLGATPVVVGLVDGIADALAAVLKAVFGRLSDARARRVPFVLLGYGISTAVRPLMSFALSPLHVVGVRALDRVGKGIRTAPRDALLADAVPAADAPRAFAFHRSMDHAGAVVGPLIASGLLAAGLSVREVIAWAWVPGILAWLTLLLARETPRASPAAGASFTWPALFPRGLRPVLVVVAVFALTCATDSFVMVRGKEVGIATGLLPLLWVVLHVAKIVAARTLGTRWANARGLLVGFALVVVGLLVLAAPSPITAFVGAALLGLGHGAREPIERTLIRARADASARGGSFGAYHLVGGIGALPGGVLVGTLWTELGPTVALVASACGVAVAGALLAVLLRPSAH